MPSLYDDQGPPLLVQGYAAVFARPYWLSAAQCWERIEPGAFELTNDAVPALFAHDRTMQYASRTTLWQDEHGLAFEFELPRSWAGLQLANSIRRGHVRSASVGLAGGRTVKRVSAGGLRIDLVLRSRLTDVSLCNSAANPWTSVWLSDEGPDELCPEIAKDRARWLIGRQQAQLARAKASRPRAAKPGPSILARIDRVLALGRPHESVVPADLPRGLLRLGPWR